MPFRSKAQMMKFATLAREGKVSETTYRAWLRETPEMRDLPERATPHGAITPKESRTIRKKRSR